MPFCNLSFVQALPHISLCWITLFFLSFFFLHVRLSVSIIYDLCVCVCVCGGGGGGGGGSFFVGCIVFALYSQDFRHICPWDIYTCTVLRSIIVSINLDRVFPSAASRMWIHDGARLIVINYVQPAGHIRPGSNLPLIFIWRTCHSVVVFFLKPDRTEGCHEVNYSCSFRSSPWWCSRLQ